MFIKLAHTRIEARAQKKTNDGTLSLEFCGLKIKVEGKEFFGALISSSLRSEGQEMEGEF